MEGIVEGGTSFQLYNPEHTIQQPKATRDEKEEYLNSNRDFVTDLAMKRAYEEIVIIFRSIIVTIFIYHKSELLLFRESYKLHIIALSI